MSNKIKIMSIIFVLILMQTVSATPLKNTVMCKEILGFYNYWVPQDEYKQMRFDLLETIIWFSLQPNDDGTLNTNRSNWPPIKLIEGVHEKNVKIILGIGSSDDDVIDNILGNPNIQSTFINKSLSTVYSNNFDGIDIDFEGINPINSVNEERNRVLMVKFMKNLSSVFWEKNKSYRISMDIPDTDIYNVWDVMRLQNYSDMLQIMGYDLWYDASSTAGPTAPLFTDYYDDPGDYSIAKSINFYLSRANKSKLMLVVPYYGFIWPTISADRKAPTEGISDYIPYSEMANKSEIYGRKWDPIWKTPWFAYKVGTQWYQGHYDDNISLGMKYDLVIAKDLAGIGIYPLGFDSGRNELWQLIEDKFGNKNKGST